MIENLGLSDNVFLCGHTKQPELVLQAADCFVLPSVSHESCPAVLAQALACGLPLITSDFGPLAEVNKDSDMGVVVPMCDAAGLSEAIQHMQCDYPAYRKKVIEKRQSIYKSLSIESMIEKTLNTYAALLTIPE